MYNILINILAITGTVTLVIFAIYILIVMGWLIYSAIKDDIDEKNNKTP